MIENLKTDLKAAVDRWAANRADGLRALEDLMGRYFGHKDVVKIHRQYVECIREMALASVPDADRQRFLGGRLVIDPRQRELREAACLIIRALEYSLNRAGLCPEAEELWAMYYTTIRAFEPVTLTLLKDLSDSLTRIVPLQSYDRLRAVFSDRDRQDFRLDCRSIHRLYAQAIERAKAIEHARFEPLYSLADLMQCFEGPKGAPPPARQAPATPLQTYRAFLSLFDEIGNFGAVRELPRPIVDRLLYMAYESAIYYLGAHLPAVYLDVSLRVAAIDITPSLINEVLKSSHSALRVILGERVEHSRPFKDSYDLACNILQRGIAAHPQAAILYAGLVELFEHRGLDQQTELIVDRLFRVTVAPDLDAGRGYNLDVALYVLGYVARSRGIHAMYETVIEIHRKNERQTHRLWAAVLHMTQVHARTYAAFRYLTVPVGDGPSILHHIIASYRSADLIQQLWGMASMYYENHPIPQPSPCTFCLDGVPLLQFLYDVCTHASPELFPRLDSLIETQLASLAATDATTNDVEMAVITYVLCLLLLARMHLEYVSLCDAVYDIAGGAPAMEELSKALPPLAPFPPQYYDHREHFGPHSPLLQCVATLHGTYGLGINTAQAELLARLLQRLSVDGTVLRVGHLTNQTCRSIVRDEEVPGRPGLNAENYSIIGAQPNCTELLQTCDEFAILEAAPLAVIFGPALADDYACLFIHNHTRQTSCLENGFVQMFETSPMDVNDFLTEGVVPCRSDAAVFHRQYCSVSPPFSPVSVCVQQLASTADLRLPLNASLQRASSIPIAGFLAPYTLNDVQALLASQEPTERTHRSASADRSDGGAEGVDYCGVQLPIDPQERVAYVSKAELPVTTPLGVAAFIGKVIGEGTAVRTRKTSWKVPPPENMRVFMARVLAYQEGAPAENLALPNPRLFTPTATIPSMEQINAILT